MRRERFKPIAYYISKLLCACLWRLTVSLRDNSERFDYIALYIGVAGLYLTGAAICRLTMSLLLLVIAVGTFILLPLTKIRWVYNVLMIIMGGSLMYAAGGGLTAGLGALL